MAFRTTAGLAALILLTACGGPAPQPPTPAPTATPSPEVAAGRQEYLQQSCLNCHGDVRQGTSLAPPLRGLGEHWTADSLAEFLRDPAPVIAATPRLTTMDERYPADMPGDPAADEETLHSLVAYLLTEPTAGK